MFHKCVCWLQCSKIDPDLEMFLQCSHLFLGTLAPSGWWPVLVHHKSITRTWTKYQAKTHLVHCKFIQNIPSQFPCSFPGSGNGQYIHNVPGDVTRMFPSGKLWEHSKFSQRKYPEFSWAVHSECSQSLGQKMARTFAVFQIMWPGCFHQEHHGNIQSFSKESIQNFPEWLIQNFLCDVPSSAITVFPVSKTQNKPELWPQNVPEILPMVYHFW